MEEDFELDEVVWAKISGYPWWPGYVQSKTDNDQYEVVFFGDFSRAFLTKTKIRKYQNIKVEKHEKRRKLINSNNTALKIVNGESSILDEITAYEKSMSVKNKYSTKKKKKKNSILKKIKKYSKKKTLNPMKRRYSKVNTSEEILPENLTFPKRRIKSMILSQNSSILTNAMEENKKLEVVEKFEKKILLIDESLRIKEIELDLLLETFQNFLEELLGFDCCLIYSSKIGILLHSLKKTAEIVCKERGFGQKFARKVGEGMAALKEKLLRNFLDNESESNSEEFIENTIKEEEEVKEESESLLNSESKINLNDKNNNLFQMDKNGNAGVIKSELKKAEEETHSSVEVFSVEPRMVFRVCKKISKVIFLNGGKGKIRSKKCKMLSEKIERFTRKNSISLGDYKHKIRSVVKAFDKNPENVKFYVLKHSQASNSLPFLNKIQLLINN